MRRLRSFAALPADERLLAIRAILWLVAARLAIGLLPFRTIRRYADRPVLRASAVLPDWPAQVRRAVLRAARTVPGSRCIDQALVAERLLRRGGHPARFVLGVAQVTGSGRPGLDAHAWVECGGFVVAGDEPDRSYAPIASYGGQA